MSDGNQTAKYIAIGCSAFLVLSCCVCGGIGALGYAMLGGPHQYAHGFFKDVREGNHPAALQRMGASYQSAHDVESFERSLASLPALAHHSDATLSSVNIDGGGSAARVGGTLTTPGGEIPVSVVLSKSGDYWYIEQVVVGGQPLQ